MCVQTAPLTNLLFLKNVLLFVHLAALGPSCSTWDLQPSLSHAGSFLFFIFLVVTCKLSVEACGNLVSQPAFEPGPPSLGDWSLNH